MLSISHMLTGAYIASKVSNPGLYIPLTLASHYLEDWIPHWDAGTGLSVGKRKRSTAIFLEVLELAVAFVLVWWFARPSMGTAGWWHIWLAALVGILPDLLEAPGNFLKWEPSFLKPINQFHNFFHHSTPNLMVGLIPQVALLILIYSF